MSQTSETQARNIAVVRDVVETLSEGGSEAVLARFEELYDPEVAWRGVGAGRDAPGGDNVFRGRDGMAAFFAEVAETLEELRFSDVGYRPVGDNVVIASGRMKATTRAAALPFKAEIHMVYELRDGRILGGENFYEPGAADDEAKRRAKEADRAEA